MKTRESWLQNGIFIYKTGLSVTKQDFHLQNRILELQTGLSPCYLPFCVTPPFIVYHSPPNGNVYSTLCTQSLTSFSPYFIIAHIKPNACNIAYLNKDTFMFS